MRTFVILSLSNDGMERLSAEAERKKYAAWHGNRFVARLDAGARQRLGTPEYVSGEERGTCAMLRCTRLGNRYSFEAWKLEMNTMAQNS